MNGVIKGIISGVAIGAFVYSTGYNAGRRQAKREEIEHFDIIEAVTATIIASIETMEKEKEKENK